MCKFFFYCFKYTFSFVETVKTFNYISVVTLFIKEKTPSLTLKMGDYVYM